MNQPTPTATATQMGNRLAAAALVLAAFSGGRRALRASPLSRLSGVGPPSTGSRSREAVRGRPHTRGRALARELTEAESRIHQNAPSSG
jgi:hypothetical protein